MLVILITLDCVRADCLNGPRGVTPHLETLAGEFTVFTQAFAQSQNTLSSHYSMLTSNYLFQHGVYSNFVQKDLPPHALPRRLAAAGWDCVAFTGVDFLSLLLGNQVGEPDPRYRLRRDRSLADRLFRRFVKRRSPADQTFDLGVDWLSTGQKAKNSFLWLHLYDTHMVYGAPKDYLKRFVPQGKADRPCRDQIADRGWFSTSFPEYRWKVPVEYFPARYKAALAYEDACLGRFIAVLKSKGLWDEALVVITADHGECLLGDHYLYCMHKKLFDTTIHVPLWVRFPGGAHAGERVDSLVQHVDLAPTVAAIAGFDEPLYMGKDLASIAAGEAGGHDFAFAEHVDDYLRAARDKEWIWMERVPGSENKWGMPLEEATFFRRDSSPAAGTAEADAQRLRKEALKLLSSRRDVAGAWGNATEASDDIARQLRRLGYL